MLHEGLVQMRLGISARVKCALLSTALLTCACQTTPREKFDSSVKVGMDKSAVIEAVGGPTISRRWKGKDRWIYRFQENAPGKYEIREVHFSNGRAVYVGKEVLPEVSAEEQDRLNEMAVAEDRRKWKEQEKRRQQNLGVVTSSGDTEDELDRKLRESMYGIPSTPQSEARKRPLKFEPIQ